ncbi:hypothetical protein JXC34_05810 [Candidatus Woesearchaeota archaeon]|nr:hypothetical protein [Candidatus Woesearchaeota archaeon]
MASDLEYYVRKRKGKLITYLNNNTDELSLEKQHQIYGAITELNRIMGLLDDSKKEIAEKERNPDEVFLLKPIYSKGVVNDFINFLKDLF